MQIALFGLYTSSSETLEKSEGREGGGVEGDKSKRKTRDGKNQTKGRGDYFNLLESENSLR